MTDWCSNAFGCLRLRCYCFRCGTRKWATHGTSSLFVYSTSCSCRWRVVFSISTEPKMLSNPTPECLGSSHFRGSREFASSAGAFYAYLSGQLCKLLGEWWGRQLKFPTKWGSKSTKSQKKGCFWSHSHKTENHFECKFVSLSSRSRFWGSCCPCCKPKGFEEKTLKK